MGNKLPAQLPVNESVFKNHPGKKYLPSSTIEVLPESRKASPGCLMAYYKALPPGVKFLDPEPHNLYWWPDVKFVPHSERQILTSVGGYLERPGLRPFPASSTVHGLLYTMTFNDRLKYRIIKGSSVPGEPNIAVHPDSDVVIYANSRFIVMMNLTTLRITRKTPDLILDNACFTFTPGSPNSRYVEKSPALLIRSFRYTTISPNGRYVAALSLCCRYVALHTFALQTSPIDTSIYSKQFSVLCHHLCDGFLIENYFTPTRPECRFSADSEYLAAGSARGQLFVVKRYELSLHCSVIPGMFTHPQVKLSNERCFDFDPRFFHRYLTFADDGKIYVCDINNSTVEMTVSLEQDVQIQSLLYSPTGRNLAVALSNGTISILDPDSLDSLYVLDATVQDVDSNMVFTPQGALPAWIHMSYSTTGNLLATSATDGKIRVWQLEPDLSLQQLCRRALLQYVPMDKICRLPLPVKLIEQLLQWPQQ